MGVEINAPNTASMIQALSERLSDLPCGGLKLALACPTYGHADVLCQKDLRVAMMVAMSYGVIWVGDASPDRMGYSSGRNKAAQNVFEDPFIDGIMWVDADIRMQTNAIASLIANARLVGGEFASGIYHQRGKPFAPVVYTYNRTKQSFQSPEDYPDNVLAPMEGCGFGFVYTSRKCLEAIAKHPSFDAKRGWFPDDSQNGGFSEDLSFCRQAMRAGVQLWVHTGIQLGHLGEPEVITKQRYMKERPTIPMASLFVQKRESL